MNKKRIVTSMGTIALTIFLITIFQNGRILTNPTPENGGPLTDLTTQIGCFYSSQPNSNNNYGMGGITHTLQAQAYGTDQSSASISEFNGVHHHVLRYKNRESAGMRSESRFCKERGRVVRNEVDGYTYVHKWKFRLNKEGPANSTISPYADGLMVSLMQLFIWADQFDNTKGMHGGALVLNSSGGLSYTFYTPMYVSGTLTKNTSSDGSISWVQESSGDTTLRSSIKADAGANSYYKAKPLLNDFSLYDGQLLEVELRVGYSQGNDGFISIKLTSGSTTVVSAPSFYRGPTRFNEQEGNAELKLGLYKGSGGSVERSWKPSIANKITMDVDDVEVTRLQGLLPQ